MDYTLGLRVDLLLAKTDFVAAVEDLVGPATSDYAPAVVKIVG